MKITRVNVPTRDVDLEVTIHPDDDGVYRVGEEDNPDACVYLTLEEARDVVRAIETLKGGEQ